MIRGIESAEQVGGSMRDQVARSLNDAPAGGASDQARQSRTVDRPLRVLRPPGARPEAEFVETCRTCGECVAVCPAQCIVIDAAVAGGKPYIEARNSPCVVCTSLACTQHCPSGALEPVGEAAAIRMGLARVNPDTCLRGEGDDCTDCIEVCPFGEDAIGLGEPWFQAPGQPDAVSSTDGAPDGHAGPAPIEVRAGCVGCGLCERACPTSAPSIIVLPWSPITGYGR